ncbi:hypothetical protein [Halomonas sp. H10-9-1]|uniref:hypothetical protein n=1 Tax=Halomonas sp. H10-9-1 TaxID=2950871 RepID=UPI0032DE41B3
MRTLRIGMLAGLLSVAAPALAAEGVLVSGVEEGQGLLRARGGECFAITPQHVVGLGGSGLSVINAERTRAPAERLTDFGDDIAVVRVEAEGRMTCGRGWPRSDSLAPLLSEAVRQGRLGSLLRVRPTGGLESYAVRFSAVEGRHVEVTPLQQDGGAFEGISGSRLMLDGRLVGMVLTTVQGVVRAYRLDALERLVADVFDSPPALPLAPRRGRVIATTRTAIRESPDAWSPALRWLEVGQSIELRGKVQGRPWWQTKVTCVSATPPANDAPASPDDNTQEFP